MQDIAAQWADPHFQARGIRHEAVHPITGSELLYRAPWRMERNGPEIRASAPVLGQDNDYMFGTLLGIDPEHLVRLQLDGVLA